MDYKFYTHPVTQHPNDWSVGIAIEYKRLFPGTLVMMRACRS